MPGDRIQIHLQFDSTRRQGDHAQLTGSVRPTHGHGVCLALALASFTRLVEGQQATFAVRLTAVPAGLIPALPVNTILQCNLMFTVKVVEMWRSYCIDYDTLAELWRAAR
jgi:hypothetical protein